MYEASLKSALEYAEQNNIEEWIHLYLLGEGNNKAFSDGLKLSKRYYKVPELMSLDLFQRDCGPEPGMKWQIPEEHTKYFWTKVNEIAELYKSGNWDMPPLIVHESNGRLTELNDGNHRYEALKILGIDRYWVIVWGNAE